MGEIKRLQQSSIQAAKEAEAADQNQHVIEKLLLQSEFMNTGTLNFITASHALLNPKLHSKCKIRQVILLKDGMCFQLKHSDARISVT